tara:strand:- start:192 stop:728 length:537 start_codon:yes stop_codon:yes gene_type:complete
MKYILILLCLFPLTLFGQRSLKVIRGEDLKGVSKYQITTPIIDSLPYNQKMGMLYNECDGWVEYFYIAKNNAGGVELILNETLTILEKNGQDISKPKYDRNYYIHLLKDTLAGGYDYSKISRHCTSILTNYGKWNGPYVLMEWRIHKGSIEWAITLTIKENLAKLLMVRRDKYEANCY